MKFLNSTTDTIIIIMILALISFTAFKITDPKDFISALGMMLTYKFGRYQAQKETTQLNG